MTYYEKKIEEATEKGAHVHEVRLQRNSGLIMDNTILINKKLREREKVGILGEEIGHHETSAGDILNYDDPNSWKQEARARAYAYDFTLGLDKIVSAWSAGCRNIYEMAELIDCSEFFLRDALEWYHEKYGISTRFKEYIIYFEPCLRVERA